MIKTTVILSLFLLFAMNNPVVAQEDATFLVTPNLDAKILIDGTEKGQTKANVALRITLTSGEHYVEIQTTDGLTVGQIVQLQAGKEETLRINIGNAESVQSVLVAELNFELPDTSTVASWQLLHEGKKYPYPEYYYAFEKGDEIILNLATLAKNGTNEITVSTYPEGIERSFNNGLMELSDVRIRVPKRSIYRFSFATRNGSARNAYLKIGRKPVSSETANFNTKVSYKKTLTPVSVVEPQNFFINNGVNSASGRGKSRIIVPVSLPPNTVEWFYRFAASRDTAVLEIVNKNFRLLGEVTKHLFSADADTAITTLALETLSQPPGANYCDIYFLDRQFTQAFETKADNQWRYLLDGSKENYMAGNVKITCCNSGQYYLGIKNPDPRYGVHVFIEVVAITSVDGYAMEHE